MAFFSVTDKKSFFLFSIVFFAADQIGKLLILTVAPQSVLINDRAVFGLSLPIPNWYFLIILATIVIWAVYFQPTAGLAMIFGGGLSNILDRYLYQGVVDLKLKNLPAFNLADILIIIGVIMVFLAIIRSQPKSAKR